MNLLNQLLWVHGSVMRFIPRPPPEPVKVCNRCSLQTPVKEIDCVHCSGLSDTQLQSFMDEHQEQLEANSNLGKYFALAAVTIFILLLLGGTNV